MPHPASKKPKLSRELVDSLLPPAPTSLPTDMPSSTGLPGITIQAAAGATVTVVVTPPPAPKGRA